MNEKKVIDKFLEMQQVTMQKNIVKATAKQKKEIYNDEHIETFGEELMVDTPGAVRKKQYVSLHEAIVTKSVLRGTITSCYVDEASKVVHVAIVQGYFKIVIPLPFLIKLPDEIIEKQRELSNDYQLKFLQMIANMRVGSVVDFIPCQINEYEGICIASRLMALDRVRYLNYFPQRDNPNPNLPIVRVGSIVQARVCYTKKASMCVEIGGVEVILRQVDISYLRIADVQDLYKAGDYVPVKITEIEYVKDENGNIVDINLKANIKEAIKNPQKENYNSYSIGESVRGIVKQRTSSGVFVRIKNSNCDVLCYQERDIAEENRADVDDEVLIRIVDKEDETYRIFGAIKWNYTKSNI